MMSKDPKARFQTPAQVAAELERWVVAAEVPLPTAEEMPQLSPAATEVVQIEEVEEAPAAPMAKAASAKAEGGSGAVSVLTRKPTEKKAKASARVEAPAASATATATAPPAPPAPPANPFKGGNNWAKPGGGPERPLPPLPTRAVAQSAVDTNMTEGDPTPPPGKGALKLDHNPFSGGDVADRPARKPPQKVVVLVLLAAAMFGGAVAALTFGGKKPAPPAAEQKG